MKIGRHRCDDLLIVCRFRQKDISIVDKISSTLARIVYFATSKEKLFLASVGFVARAEGDCYKRIRRNRRFLLVPNDTLITKAGNTYFEAPLRSEKYGFQACVVKKQFFLHMHAKPSFAHRLQTAKMVYSRTRAQNNGPRVQNVLTRVLNVLLEPKML